MVGKKLQNSGWILIGLCLVGSLALADALATRKKPTIGLTLDWYSIGTDVEIHYIRTQGGRNERETATFISKRSSKQAANMTGDVDGLPEWMDVEWQYGLTEGPTWEAGHKNAKNAKAHFDLKALVPESAIEEVARDPNRKQLKLVGTFNDDKLDLRYEVYQWRQ